MNPPTAQDITPEPGDMTIPEAARRLGVSLPTIRELIRRGELSAFVPPRGHAKVYSQEIAAIQRRAYRPARSPSHAAR